MSSVTRIDILRSRLFFRLVATYIALLLLFLLISLITFSTVYDTIRGDAFTSGRSAIENVSRLVESRLIEIEAIGNQIALDNRVRTVFSSRDPFEDVDYYRMYEAKNALMGYAVTNQFLTALLLYHPPSNLLLGPEFATARSDMMYSFAIGYENLSFPEFHRLFESAQQYSFFRPSHRARPMLRPSDDYLSFHVSILRSGHPAGQAFVIALIPTARLQEIMDTAGFGQRGYWTISDNDGVNIAAGGDTNLAVWTQRPPDNSVVVLSTTSAVHDLRYAVVQPVTVFTARIDRFRAVFVIGIVILIAISLLAAFVFAYRNSQPIEQIVNTIRNRFDSIENASPAENEYAVIERAIEALAADADTMRHQIDRYRPILAARYFDLLLRQGMHGGEETQSLQQYLNIDLGNGPFAVFIVQIDGFNDEISVETLQDIERQKILLLSITDLLAVENRIFAHTTEPGKIAVLVVFDADDDHARLTEACRRMARLVIDRSSRSGINQVTVGIGRVYADAGDIQHSYLESLECLDMVSAGDAAACYHIDDFPHDSAAYRYPIDVEAKILQFAKMGEFEQLVNVLRNSIAQNIRSQCLSPAMVGHFVGELTGTVYRACANLRPEDAAVVAEVHRTADTLRLSADVDELESKLTCVFAKITSAINNRKKSRNIQLRENLIDFIEKRHTDFNLNLAMIADHFHLTETYLSHFFKEQTGENFSTYLETRRLAYATEAMEDPSNTVLSIATAVGYANVNTFYKAFKRVYGMTPTEYRSNRS